MYLSIAYSESGPSKEKVGLLFLCSLAKTASKMKGSSGGEESVNISFQAPSRERDHPRAVGFVDQTPADSHSIQKKNFKRDPFLSQSSSIPSAASRASRQQYYQRSAPLTKSIHYDLNESSSSLQNSSHQAWIPPGKAVTGRDVGCGKTSRDSREGIREKGRERAFELTTLPIVYSDGTNQSSRSLLKKETEKLHGETILSEGRPPTTSLNPDYAAVFYFKHNDLYGKNLEKFTSTLGTMESTSERHGLKSK